MEMCKTNSLRLKKTVSSRGFFIYPKLFDLAGILLGAVFGIFCNLGPETLFHWLVRSFCFLLSFVWRVTPANPIGPRYPSAFDCFFLFFGRRRPAKITVKKRKQKNHLTRNEKKRQQMKRSAAR